MSENLECWVIATLKDYRPVWDKLVRIFKDEIPEVMGLKLAEGPGCGNLGICLPEGNEEIIRKITMQLQPARYAKAADAPFTGYINETVEPHTHEPYDPDIAVINKVICALVTAKEEQNWEQVTEALQILYAHKANKVDA